MSPVRIVAVLLLLVGALGVGYGGFSFTKERHTAEIGSLKMSVDEKQHVNIPQWAGIFALFAGAVLLVVPIKKA